MNEPTEQCLVCQRSSQEIPLITLNYRQQKFFICPQHFPILIHEPDKLVGKLPGAERLSPHEH